MTESAPRTLEIGDLTPGARVSGAHAEVYFDPSEFRCYEFSNVGSGWPMMAHNRRHFEIGSIPLDLADADALAEVVRGLEPLLATVAEGYDEKWDGSNTVGTLTDVAREALDKAREEYAEAVQSMPTLWDAGEWFEPVRSEVVGELLVAESLQVWAVKEVESAKPDAHLNLADVVRYGADQLRAAVEAWQEQVDDCEGELDEDAEGALENIARAKQILAAL